MHEPTRGLTASEHLEGATQFGLLEDEHLRAEVTTRDAETYVRLEGDVDRADVPVVEELLDAVDRWHRALGRRKGRGPAGRGAVPDPGRGAPATLLVDTTAVDRFDPLGWQMLEHHQARWRAERGPCHLTGRRPHGSSR